MKQKRKKNRIPNKQTFAIYLSLSFWKFPFKT